MPQGLNKIWPHAEDYSLLHTFGGTTDGLPDNFSVYDGRVIPNQNILDEAFTPAMRPLPEGCTAETTCFDAGIEDGLTYPPDDFYFATPPGTDGTGRDVRTALSTATTRGFKLPDGTIGNKRAPYFNCYGAGAIDDFDAARIALWINQGEKSGVSIGSWWYWGANPPIYLPTPSFNMSEATLHNYLATGWITFEGTEYLECIPWCGMNVGNKGIVYISRVLYNALMAQPYTGAFTISKLQGTPVTVGVQAWVDHLVYYVRNLFGILPA